jgi:hypothetical protein
LSLTVPTLPAGALISDPRNVDYVLRHDGTLFGKGAFVRDRAWDLFGHGIINAEGDFWKLQRRAGISFLSASNLRVLTEVALPKCLATVVAHVRSQAGGDEMVDLQCVFHDITTMLMGKMAYNVSL